MKKLILILILLLTFTLIGDCWVSGYGHRVKLTIDHTKIDDTLTNFPVTAFFTDAQAEEIFTEFDADEDFDRGQFALGDDTLLKAEKELFDDSESKGLYHVKIPSISSSANTDYYFYYNNNADHNTSYIGIIGSAVAAEVWIDYKFVCHMTADFLDSTSNNNDPTNIGTEDIAGKVGQGRNFIAGNSDHITIPNLGITTGARTLETCLYVDQDEASWQAILGWGDMTAEQTCLLHFDVMTNNIYLGFSNNDYYTANDVLSTGSWYHIVGVYDGGAISTSTVHIYINGVNQELTKAGGYTGSANTADNDYLIGRNIDDGANYLDGSQDEPRVSNTNRSAAWAKGSYNSLWDTLLTYGSEESTVEEVNAIFFGTNF